MAENKKSFVLYVDLKHTVSKLPDEIAGKLFKLILSYVNDENPPDPTDLILQIAFEPIKQQLKRDLKDWESERLSRSMAGKKGMANRWHNKDNTDNTVITKDNTVITPITNITDNVSVSVNDNVSVTKKNTKVFIPPILLDVISYFKENGYTEQVAERAFRYYNDANWVDSKGSKVKNWKQKMQGVWFKDENKIPLPSEGKFKIEIRGIGGVLIKEVTQEQYEMELKNKTQIVKKCQTS